MIQQRVKKVIFRILCNNMTGAVIESIYKDRVPDLRWPKFRFRTSGAGMEKWVLASIFWGFYEGAEVRFIEKYFKGDTDVVELGASSGIISAHIVSKLQKGKRLISVEANNMLADVWQENTKRHNVNGAESRLLHYAVSYKSESVMFGISSNTTESRLAGPTAADAGKVIAVPAINLQTIVENNQLNGYTLFCDIEGAEIEILQNEHAGFISCRDIFIELHDLTYEGQRYDAERLIGLILEKGFRLVDRYGYVCYFRNTLWPEL